MPIPLRSTLFACAALLCFASPAAAQPQPADSDPVFEVKNRKSDLRIVEKFAKILKLDKRIRTVSGFDQDVISVSKVEASPTMIRVHAEKPGVTSLVIADEDGRMFTVEAFVIGDVRHLQAYLKRLFPHSAVTAVAIGDTVVLRGWVAQPETITEMREIAEQFFAKVVDQMKVGGVQQVKLKVRVMEVNRGKVRRLGFNFFHADQNGAVSSTPGQLTQLTQFGQAAATFAGVGDPTVAFEILGENSVFQGFLEALKSEQLLKILAEPELVTTNGRPAELQAGGEFPFLVPQGVGPVGIQWKKFGVRLNAVPIILGQGRVRLELRPEVSERDFTSGVQTQGFTVPGVTNRYIDTQVEMRFGETFMIAGLLNTRATATTDKVVFLGDLPYIGAAFRRVRYEETETELVIMVTPELVAPMKAEQVPPGGPGLFTDTPTDRELYFDGRLEVPRYGDRCQGCNVDSVFTGPNGPHLQGVQPIHEPESTSNHSRVLNFKTGTSTGPAENLPIPPMPRTGAAVSPQSHPGPGRDDTSMRARQQPQNRSVFDRFRKNPANARAVSSSGNPFQRAETRQPATGSQNGLIRPASGYQSPY